LCGTALDTAAFTALMGEERASAVFTDPPYNVPIDGHASGLGAIHHRPFPMASGEMDRAEFTAFLRQIFRNLAAFSSDGALQYICMCKSAPKRDPARICNKPLIYRRFFWKLGSRSAPIGTPPSCRFILLYQSLMRWGPGPMLIYNRLRPRTIVLADKAYDADRIRELIQDQDATPNIPPKSNRRWKPALANGSTASATSSSGSSQS
jgi:hypothetical protein